VLKGVSMDVVEGQLTAIVGPGGSGKSTLLKLLLKLYAPSSGQIKAGELDLQTIPQRWWREQCGAILQDSEVFSDTVVGNITLSTNAPDEKRLREAITLAGIDAFVKRLPKGYDTKIGAGGIGLSAGEFQRILLARMIYKNPSYVFLDEATSALDPEQELEVWERLEGFLAGKTVVVIAHRLSTVMSADKLLVLQDGQVVQYGDPQLLKAQNGLFRTMLQHNKRMNW
ncbi:MAG TPA: ATP-binding cassette domain-containing protein, partial [Candidatus Paceibacterota bacterium]|nr:ATP-binding cassette domain-containing protein [Candidatus Paceibacterota bacterium]